MDRCIFAGGWSYWPGFFSQDVMRASAYKHINIASRNNKSKELHLTIIDRKDNRGFALHSKWVDILRKHFPVIEFTSNDIDSYVFLSLYGQTVIQKSGGTVL